MLDTVSGCRSISQNSDSTWYRRFDRSSRAICLSNSNFSSTSRASSENAARYTFSWSASSFGDSSSLVRVSFEVL